MKLSIFKHQKCQKSDRIIFSAILCNFLLNFRHGHYACRIIRARDSPWLRGRTVPRSFVPFHSTAVAAGFAERGERFVYRRSISMDSSSSGGVSRNGVANKVREAGTTRRGPRCAAFVHENAWQCFAFFSAGRSQPNARDKGIQCINSESLLLPSCEGNNRRDDRGAFRVRSAMRI